MMDENNSNSELVVPVNRSFTEPRYTKDLITEQAKLHSTPRTTHLLCSDLEPRRTAKMLQSPLHQDMRMASRVPTPRIISPTPSKVMESIPESRHTEPRRTKDMFKTPVQTALRSVSKISTPRAIVSGISVPKILISTPTKEKDLISKNLNFKQCRSNKQCSPLRTAPCSSTKLAVPTATSSEMFKSMEKNLHSEPRRTKEMLQSPLHAKSRPISSPVSAHLYSEPRRTKEMLQSPLHAKSRPLSSPVSAHLYSEPRRTKEMLQSPLHRNARSAITTKLSVSTPTQKPKEFLTPQRTDKSRPVRRNLQFNEQALEAIMERIVNYLRETSIFQATVKRGIQHLCLQDFKDIISHLLAFTGVPLKSLDKTNYIDITMQSMEKLNYPTKVKKSWLLMPSASLQHIMQIFDFLLDFVPMEKEDFPFDFQTESDKELYVSIAKEYQKLHQKPSTSKSSLCSDQEFQCLGVGPLPPEKETQIEEQPEEHPESESESIDDLESLTLQVQKLRVEETQLENEIAASEKQLERIKQESAQHENTMGKLCIQLWHKGYELKELKMQRDASQIVTYTQLLDTRNLRHSELKIHCRQLNELVERTHNQRLVLKRSRSDLLENIEAYNVFVRDLYYSSVLGNYCPSSLELSLNPTLAEIEERQKKLTEVRRVLAHVCTEKAEEYNKPLTEVNSNVEVKV